jgi:hypothetical protein
MTGADMTSYSLTFAGFSIEFRVDEQSSVDFTNRFDSHGPDFVFAVAETWLHKEGSNQLIIPATHPENFLERLRDLSARVSSPPSVPGLEEVIPCGGWCSWMAGYWDRVEKETNVAEDEKLYDLLIPLSFAESRIGHIALYMYGGKKIFEVATRLGEHEEHHAVGAWSQFSADALGNEIADLEKVVAADIRGSIKKQL